MDKPVVIPISYEGLDNEVIKTLPEDNNYNNCYYIISDSDSDDQEKREEENFFEQGDLEMIIETTLNSKVVSVMKNLQAYFNEGANKRNFMFLNSLV